MKFGLAPTMFKIFNIILSLTATAFFIRNRKDYNKSLLNREKSTGSPKTVRNFYFSTCGFK